MVLLNTWDTVITFCLNFLLFYIKETSLALYPFLPQIVQCYTLPMYHHIIFLRSSTHLNGMFRATVAPYAIFCSLENMPFLPLMLWEIAFTIPTEGHILLYFLYSLKFQIVPLKCVLFHQGKWNLLKSTEFISVLDTDYKSNLSENSCPSCLERDHFLNQSCVDFTGESPYISVTYQLIMNTAKAATQ